MADAFVGKYKLENSDNFEGFMKELGVNIALRKIGNATKPSLTVSKDGDAITFFSESSFKNFKVTFKLGVEFEDSTQDGRKCKSTITLDGGKLVQKERPSSGDGPEVTYVREINADGDLFVKCTTGSGVVCTRLYKKC